eukprot:XP_019924366.1 PREDICTED: multiple epidermal growth factor-like domains protein 6 [Crassostrea gigas]
MILLMCAAMLFIGYAKQGPCKTPFNGCCPDTHWDPDKNKCIECQPGFFAVNCSRECLYPYYGEKCNLNCSCDREHCNFMVGCETGKTNQGVANVSNATHDASKAIPTANTTNKLFILLMIATSLLVAIGIAYTAVLITGKYWNRTQREVVGEL